MRCSASLFILLVAARGLAAQPTVAAPDPLVQRFLRLTEARVTADFKADRASLDTLLASDLTYGRSSGVLDTKEEVLKEVGPGGPYQLDYLTPDSLRARRYGSAGIVTGILRVKLSAQPSPYRIRFTDVWAQRAGRWQLVSFQATRLTDAGAAPATTPRTNATGSAPSSTGRVRRFNPAGLSAPTGYTHVMVEADGRTVHISGQVALDSTGAIVGIANFRAQAERVYENLRIALASVGASFKDVVKSTTFMTDMLNVPVLREVRAHYYQADALPASTAVQVVALVRPELLLEIEVTALLPQPLPDR